MRSHATRLAAIALLFSATVPVRADAEIRYVAPPANGGSDANAGTAQSPWATVDHALAQVTGGDEIVVRDGIYEGGVYHAGGFDDWVTVRAEHAYRAKLTNAAAGGTVVHIATKGSAKIVFLGFVFSNAHPSYSCPGGREASYVVHVENAEDVTFRDNIIFGNNAPGSCNELFKVNRGDAAQYPRNITISGNLFYDHANAGGADMIDAVRPGELDITENIFFARAAPLAQSFITLKRQVDPATVGVTPRSPRFVVARNVFLSYDGKTDQAFVQLGEDGNAEVMISDALIENNLLLGDSARQMAAPFQLKGARGVTVRANTIVGDLPSGAYGLRIGTEGDNPQAREVALLNNIWSDPKGTMGDRFINTYGDVAVATITLDHNLFFNGGNPLPTTEVPAPSADAHRVTDDPLLSNEPTEIELPVWDEESHAFRSGNTTIREELERLVLTYGAIDAASPARDAADAATMPADDILGRARDGQPDIGAFEVLASAADHPATGGDSPRADATGPADAAASEDSAAGGDGARGDEGCGCEVGARAAPALWWAGLLLLLVASRRGRRVSASAPTSDRGCRRSSCP